MRKAIVILVQDENQTAEKFAELFARYPYEHHLDLSYRAYEEGGLRQAIGLRSLLSFHELGDEAIRAIAVALKHNTGLESLDLSCNTLSLEAVIALAEALRVNKSLRSLNLAYCDLSPEAISVLAELSSTILSCVASNLALMITIPMRSKPS